MRPFFQLYGEYACTPEALSDNACNRSRFAWYEWTGSREDLGNPAEEVGLEDMPPIEDECEAVGSDVDGEHFEAVRNTWEEAGAEGPRDEQAVEEERYSELHCEAYPELDTWAALWPVFHSVDAVGVGVAAAPAPAAAAAELMAAVPSALKSVLLKVCGLESESVFAEAAAVVRGLFL